MQASETLIHTAALLEAATRVSMKPCVCVPYSAWISLLICATGLAAGVQDMFDGVLLPEVAEMISYDTAAECVAEVTRLGITSHSETVWLHIDDLNVGASRIDYRAGGYRICPSCRPGRPRRGVVDGSALHTHPHYCEPHQFDWSWPLLIPLRLGTAGTGSSV